MDKAWMSTDRLSATYRKGVDALIKFTVRNEINKSWIKKFAFRKPKSKIIFPCPCEDCVNHKSWTRKWVKYHLFRYGIDQNYIVWTKHSEKEVYRSPTNMDFENFETMVFEDTNANHTSEIPSDAKQTIHMVGATDENFLDDPEKLRKLLEDAQKPLYEGCPNFTKLSAIVKLFNIKSRFGMSNSCFTALLKTIKEMLPAGNKMYQDTYEAKKAITHMGSGYEKIHVCVNDCILYRKEYEDLTECPTYGESRWKEDEVKKIIYYDVPAKSVWYFPIIPRLKRLYQCKGIAESLRWHDTGIKKDRIIRHPADSKAWQALNNEYADFAKEPRNLHLGISADGVDVNRGNQHHSVWPILMVIYNLPPWLCMKRKYIMLSLLILGRPGNDIDVFLAPLLEDLQLLFDNGVETYDAFAKEKFNLHAVVLWTINDYPALGTLSGCPYIGKRGCVVCGENTQSISLPHSKKQSYTVHRRYLPYEHPLRRQKKAFNGNQELTLALERMTGQQIYDQVKYIRNTWGKACKDKESQDQTSTGRGGKITKKTKKTKESQVGTSEVQEGPYWKKFNIWSIRLRYWKHNSVQHMLDFMHIVKNVGENLTGTMLNVAGKSKDGLKARMDLVDLKLKPDLQPQVDGDKTTLPAATFTLTNAEKENS